MLTTCPWGYPPGLVCVTCKHKHNCALRPKQKMIAVNGLFGVWREGTQLLIENTHTSLTMPASQLDSLIRVLEAAQEELARPWEPQP